MPPEYVHQPMQLTPRSLEYLSPPAEYGPRAIEYGSRPLSYGRQPRMSAPPRAYKYPY